MAEMGQTGMGIMKEADLDMSLENHITNCWSEYKIPCYDIQTHINTARIRDKHPWFWMLKGIISERPNLVPAGIGNNESGFDISLLQTKDLTPEAVSGYVGDFGESSSDGFGLDNDHGEDEEEDKDEDEDGDEENKDRRKRKRKDEELGEDKKPGAVVGTDSKKSRGPRAGKSVVAQTAVSTKKGKTTGIDRFADIAAREEETTQKALELKKTKFESNRDKAVAKVKAKADIQMNKDKLRAELAQKKLELEYKFKL